MSAPALSPPGGARVVETAAAGTARENRGQAVAPPALKRQPTTTLRPQTAAARVGDDDWAFPAAERYFYSSANASAANTVDDIDLELISLDRFFLSVS